MPNDCLCGIDEAGRGPIAGPLVVCGLILHHHVTGLRDSKKLSPKQRATLFDTIITHSTYHTVIIEATTIDTQGLSACMKDALQEIIHTLWASRYLFDGNTTFGVSALETLVKADDQIDEVRAASIVAKVTRDRIMDTLDVSYPHYGFKSHKGYGTKAHVQAIQTYGYTPQHRVSFKLKSLQPRLF